MLMSNRRVVITGLGWVTPLGQDVGEVWADLLAGKSGIDLIRRFDTSQYTVRIAGECSGFTHIKGVEDREMKRLDRFVQFALSAAIDAVEESGLDFCAMDPYRAGVVIGSGVGGIEEFEHGHRRMLEKGPRRASPFMIPKLMVNAASAHVSIQYGIKGINSACVTACASGGHSIVDAHKAISQNEADVVVTGGAEAAVTPLGVACFMTMRALSSRNDDPQRASRPFDVDRDGFVMAEGAGVLVLEEYEHAKKRNAPIYGELIGYGMTADGSHITAPKEDGEGAAQAMRRALQMAQVQPDQVDYINGHATSTSLGDLAENRAIKTVFGDHAYKLAVSSTKSMLGHSLGASGGIEAVVAAKTLQTGNIHPTINLDQPDEGCDLNYVANQAQQRPVSYVMSNSFGFGGHNVSLLIRKL